MTPQECRELYRKRKKSTAPQRKGRETAKATSERQIAHYAAIYGQDGPVRIESRSERGRWKAHTPAPHKHEGE